jgi:hypothetical protein
VSSKHGFRRRAQTIASQISVNSQSIDWNETILRPLSGGPKELHTRRRTLTRWRWDRTTQMHASKGWQVNGAAYIPLQATSMHGIQLVSLDVSEVRALLSDPLG